MTKTGRERSVSAASHHLRLLRQAGAVTYREAGRMACYRLADDRDGAGRIRPPGGAKGDEDLLAERRFLHPGPRSSCPGSSGGRFEHRTRRRGTRDKRTPGGGQRLARRARVRPAFSGLHAPVRAGLLLPAALAATHRQTRAPRGVRVCLASPSCRDAGVMHAARGTARSPSCPACCRGGMGRGSPYTL